MWSNVRSFICLLSRRNIIIIFCFLSTQKYVQIVAALYSIFSIPLFGMWWFVMGPALRWFGLDTAAVDIGIQYTKVLIFNYYLDGIFTVRIQSPLFSFSRDPLWFSFLNPSFLFHSFKLSGGWSYPRCH